MTATPVRSYAAADVLSRIFDDLTPAARAEVLAAARPRLLKAHEVLAEQGAPATTFYVVQVGHLKLSQVSADGREVIARFAGPGQAFGGIVVLGHPKYPVSATAIEPSRVLGWARSALMALVETHPSLRTKIVEEIARHMTDALARVQELTTERVSQRLARTLLRLAAHGGRPGEAGIEILHPITRQELADLVGATLFTVSRLLARWEERGLIRSTRSHVTLVQTAELEAITTNPED
jgi:CRP-like cAMP-binding protein